MLHLQVPYRIMSRLRFEFSWSWWWPTWRSAGTFLRQIWSRSRTTFWAKTCKCSCLKWAHNLSRCLTGPYGLHSSSSESISTAFDVLSMEFFPSTPHSHSLHLVSRLATRHCLLQLFSFTILSTDVAAVVVRLCEPGSGPTRFGDRTSHSQRHPLFAAATIGVRTEFQESAPPEAIHTRCWKLKKMWICERNQLNIRRSIIVKTPILPIFVNIFSSSRNIIANIIYSL